MKKLIISFCFLGLTFLVGCTGTPKYDVDFQYTQKWGEEFFELKNPEQYKPKLQEEINYFLNPEYSNKNEIYFKSSMLKLAYMRLFIIDDALGNKAEANISLLKAKYWCAVMLEHSLNKTPPNEIDSYIKTMTEENVRKWIKKLNPEFFKNVDNMKK